MRAKIIKTADKTERKTAQNDKKSALAREKWNNLCECATIFSVQSDAKIY